MEIKEPDIITSNKVNPTEKEIEEVKNLLNKKNKNFSIPYILRNLHEKSSLRKIFLSVFKNSPCKISEICEDTLSYKQNCYPLLNQLVSMNLLKRTFIIDVFNGNIDNVKMLEKFNNWTKTMPENTRRYYLAKTSYWEITDFGKRFVVESYKFEQEFMEKEDG